MTHKERIDMLKHIAESAAVLAGHASECGPDRLFAHLYDAADIAAQEAGREALHYPAILNEQDERTEEDEVA